MTTPPVILGVDPGASGAVAALDAVSGSLLWVEDMPHHDGIVSGALIADLLLNEDVACAWIEKVSAMPKQGVSSTFKFGQAYGSILGALGALKVPVEHVTPSVWKKGAGLLRADKDGSRRRAVETWPSMAEFFRRVKDDGRAEAALIARHGWLALHRQGAGVAP